ncbi:MAG: hypothetical protein PHF00_10330, partial [Elusimicrobia bacterium]|nr:hypothetical protein [Elusimicrobiota bacterium]
MTNEPEPPEPPAAPHPPPPELIRPAAAQGLLAQQDALRSEVEASLKTLREQLRAEKSEKETEEEKSRSRGRIDALEKRLDEMPQAWAGLLKDAIVQRDATAGSELNAVLGGLRELQTRLAEWRGDVAGLPETQATLRALARDLPRHDQSLRQGLEERLDAFAGKVDDKLAQFERQRALEAQRQETRLSELGRERAALQKLAEEQNHAVRLEQLQERAVREKVLDDKIARLSLQLEAVAAEQSQAAQAGSALKGELAKMTAILATPPKAKDQIIAELEREKS